jgi:hypothetical protein
MSLSSDFGVSIFKRIFPVTDTTDTAEYKFQLFLAQDTELKAPSESVHEWL